MVSFGRFLLGITGKGLHHITSIVDSHGWSEDHGFIFSCNQRWMCCRTKVLPHFCCKSQNMRDYHGVNVEKNLGNPWFPHGFPQDYDLHSWWVFHIYVNVWRRVPGLVNIQKTMENGHRNSGFTH